MPLPFAVMSCLGLDLVLVGARNGSLLLSLSLLCLSLGLRESGLTLVRSIEVDCWTGERSGE